VDNVWGEPVDKKMKRQAIFLLQEGRRMGDESPRKFAVQQAASGIDRRNLRGRCGGQGVWKRELPLRARRAVSGACLVRGRRSHERRSKRRALLDCKATFLRKGRRDERSTAGDQRGERENAATRRVPGRWKAS
jgi:hypothetical protein